MGPIGCAVQVFKFVRSTCLNFTAFCAFQVFKFHGVLELNCINGAVKILSGECNRNCDGIHTLFGNPFNIDGPDGSGREHGEVWRDGNRLPSSLIMVSHLHGKDTHSKSH